MKKVKLRTLTDEQFISAPQEIRSAHLKVRIGKFDLYSKEAERLIKTYPTYFLKEPMWPNNPVRIISLAVRYVWSEIKREFGKITRK